MGRRWFNPPIPITGENADVTYIVADVDAVADHLLQFTERGPKWNQAVRVCAAALADEASPQEVRRCFKLAAKEAGKLHNAYRTS
ncbi:DUF982 domain-containing protein [Mesorhizobium sp. B2-6-4]|uniref:DUF982 domain-containing protein n=1 Tax=Mesorhizobium sp. B2-6-4 TaxID=2589913 RepID=UPI00112C2128|nr:DUF982 domain-containing protein [Mesorhizobium sp. B2-6-4]TPJ49633.1 DUF982 domain-containing protein [Mesorhizobium sp. B2-6-4]